MQGFTVWRTCIWKKVGSIILVLVILSVIGMIVYTIASPKFGQRLTESYILGSEGKAADYPTEVVVGETYNVIMGIVNHDHERVTYRLEVRINGVKNNEVGWITLEQDEKWEQEVSFIPKKTGENQEVEFCLHRNGEVELILPPLRLWIDARE